MNKKFAIFDFDGCLVDSMFYWKNLSKEYLQNQGIKTDFSALSEEIKAMTLRESSKYFKEKFKIEKEVEEIYQTMVTTINHHYIYDVPIKKGADLYLKKLYEKDIRMCIASSSEEKLIQKAIRRLNIEEYFEFIVSNDRIGKGKDKPDIYNYCRDKFKAKTEEIAVYEDAFYAIKTAKKAGFFTIAVRDKRQEKDFEKIKVYADQIIEDFTAEAKEL
jgi:HAD superfamily hydrolase (TIGR01509 family)